MELMSLFFNKYHHNIYCKINIRVTLPPTFVKCGMTASQMLKILKKQYLISIGIKLFYRWKN